MRRTCFIFAKNAVASFKNLETMKLTPVEISARMATMDLSGEVPTASFAYAALLKAPHLRESGFDDRMNELLAMWELLPSTERDVYVKDPLKGLRTREGR